MSANFAHDFEVVRWVASQLPNLPHIQEHLGRIADKLEAESIEAAKGLGEVAAVVVAGGAAQE